MLFSNNVESGSQQSPSATSYKQRCKVTNIFIIHKFFPYFFRKKRPVEHHCQTGLVFHASVHRCRGTSKKNLYSINNYKCLSIYSTIMFQYKHWTDCAIEVTVSLHNARVPMLTCG